MCTQKTISTIELGKSNKEKAENLSLDLSGSERSNLSACFSQWKENFNQPHLPHGAGKQANIIAAIGKHCTV